MLKQLQKIIKVYPWLDGPLKKSRITDAIKGMSLNEDEADAVIAERNRLVEKLMKITKRGLMK